MNVNPIDKTNWKNIYCAHCKHWIGCFCHNEESRFFEQHRYKWNMCKDFEWNPDLHYYQEDKK